MAKCLYNGVLLPELPEWDESIYRCAYIVYSPLFGMAQWKLYAGTEFIYRQTSSAYQVGFPSYKQWTTSGGGWSAGSDVANETYLSTVGSSSIKWTNADILNSDGTVALAASDPISLADQTIIEWDGDMTDRPSVSDEFGTYYRVADAPSEAQCLGGYLVWDTGLALVTHENKNVPEALWRIVDGGLYLLGGDGQHIAIFTYTTALPPSIHPQSFWNGYLLGQKVRRMLKPRKRTYLYNGTELPSLPVWDRKELPYAILTQVTWTDGVDYYYLVCCNIKPDYKPTTSGNIRFYIPAGTKGVYLQYKYEGNVWNKQGPYVKDRTDKTSGAALYWNSALWTNTDILGADDGTLYLAASRPVLVP